MSNDGKVIIDIQSNAAQAAKEFANLDKQTQKYNETLQDIKTCGFSETEKSLSLLKKEMKDMALAGLQNTKAFKDFAGEAKILQSNLNNAKSSVSQAIKGQNDLSNSLKQSKKSTDDSVISLEKLNKAQRSNLGIKELGNVTGNAVEKLKNLALQGRQNSAEFEKLAQSVKSAKLQMSQADKTVGAAIGLEPANNTNALAGALSSLKGAAIPAAVAIAGLKLKDYAVDATKTAASFEQLGIDFKILSGNAQLGEKLTKELIALANVTPMTTQGLSRNAQTLLSFGEASQNVIGDLKLLGNITGGNQQRMDSLTLAFAQAGASGRLLGQDLLQMVNAGFNPLQIMSETTGKSMGKLKKEMEEGKISFSMIKQAMIDATSEGGRYAGRMEEQSKSLNGLLSTNADRWELVAKKIGDDFLPMSKAAVQGFINLADVIIALQKKMDDFHKNVTHQTTNSQQNIIDEMKSRKADYELKLKSATSQTDKNFFNAQIANLQTSIALSEKGLATLKKQNSTALQIKKSINTGFKDSMPETKDKKSKRDTLQSRMSDIQDKMQKLALAGKQNTAEFASLTAQYNKYKTAVDAVNAVLDGKGAFERLQANASESVKKLQDLAASNKVNTEEFRKAKKEATDYAIKIEKLQEATRLLLSPYDALTDKLQKLQKEMQNMAAASVVNLEELKKLKTEYAKIAESKKHIDQLMETNPQNQFANQLSNVENNYKNMVYSNALAPGMFTPEQLKNAKNQYQQWANYQKQINAQIASSAGLDWSNLRSSLSTDLASALTTPLQQGENAFERFGNVALNTVQRIASKMLETFVFDKVFNNLSQQFTSSIAPVLQSSAQSYASMASTAPVAAVGIMKIGAAQTASLAAFKASSATFTSSMASYKTAAISAQQLAASITQAAIAQAAYSAALVPVAGAALAPIAALATGASIGAANIIASAGMLSSRLTAFANGGALSNGKVLPFAKGTVINSRTKFPMADGSTGLMSEQKPEAIMPLARGAGGRLGVEASNVNRPNINIYNQSSSQIETVQRPDGDYDVFIRKVNNALNNERTNTGFTRAMQRNNSKGIQAC